MINQKIKSNNRKEKLNWDIKKKAISDALKEKNDSLAVHVADKGEKNEVIKEVYESGFEKYSEV